MIGSFGIGPLAAVSAAPGSIAAARAGEVLIAAVPAATPAVFRNVSRLIVVMGELLSLLRVGRTPFVRPDGSIGSIRAAEPGATRRRR